MVSTSTSYILHSTINFFVKKYFSFATVLSLYELFEAVLDDDSSCRGLLNLIKKDSSFEPINMDCDGLKDAPLFFFGNEGQFTFQNSFVTASYHTWPHQDKRVANI